MDSSYISGLSIWVLFTKHTHIYIKTSIPTLLAYCFQGVFILLTGGLIMSLVAFGCEVATYWSRVYVAKQQDLKHKKKTLARKLSASSVWF